MMSSETILPDSVAIFKNIEAFDLAAKTWIDDLKLESVASVFDRSGRC
jgi:hypothetical protein